MREGNGALMGRMGDGKPQGQLKTTDYLPHY
jgi:hypothetical protein